MKPLQVDQIVTAGDTHVHRLNGALADPKKRPAILLVVAGARRELGSNNFASQDNTFAGQAVDHVHFHIIPKPSDGEGLGVKWPAGKLDHATAGALAARVRELCSG